MKNLYQFLKISNRIIRGVMTLVTVCVLAFAGFMVWDNQQVYRNANDVQLAMQQLKPQSQDGKTYSFEELLAINPDVNSWITMDGTNIDYPVVRGEDNWYYLNRDVFREYALAGSIYMDSRNAADYSDIYNILYGHHMENHAMFSDLDLYKDEEFFKNNTTGTLILPDRLKHLRVAAVLESVETEREIFDPRYYTWELSGLCSYLRENAMLFWEDVLSEVEAKPDRYQAIALITCTSGITNNRTVLIVITDYDYPHKPEAPIDPSKPDDTEDGDDHDKPTDSSKPDGPSHGSHNSDDSDGSGDSSGDSSTMGRPSKDKDNPKTGESDIILLWYALTVLCGVGMVTVTVLYFRSNKDKQE